MIQYTVKLKCVTNVTVVLYSDLIRYAMVVPAGHTVVHALINFLVHITPREVFSFIESTFSHTLHI
jgi:hypothetical protein